MREITHTDFSWSNIGGWGGKCGGRKSRSSLALRVYPTRSSSGDDRMGSAAAQKPVDAQPGGAVFDFR